MRTHRVTSVLRLRSNCPPDSGAWRISTKGGAGFVLFLFALVGFVLYGRTLSYDFINWDDITYIVNNENIRKLSLHNISRIFSLFLIGEWFPLQLLSYAVDYSLWGLNPAGYHLGNIILHIFNAFIVFLLLKRICPNDDRIGLMAAMLFLVHPVQVESVVWISQRKTVLCTFFFLLSFLSYLRWRERGTSGLYMTSLVLFTFSLLSKVYSFMLPLILLVWEYSLGHPRDNIPSEKKGGFRERWSRLKVILVPLIPFGLISMGAIVAFLYGQISEKVITELFGGTPYTNFLTTCAGFVLKYPNRLPFPVNLSAYYPRVDEYYSLFTPPFLIAVPVWILCNTLFLHSYRMNTTAFFFALFFAIQMFPTSGFVPGPFGGADRYLYILSITVFALFSMGLVRLSKRFPRVVATAFFIVIGLFSVLTVERCTVWKNSMTLWEDVASKSPQLPYAHFKLAQSYLTAGRLNDAAEHSRLSVSLDPTVALYFYTQGLIYRSMENYPEALSSFSLADALEPGNSVLHREIAVTYENMKDWDKAIKEYNKSIALDPDKAYISMRNLGALYIRLNRYSEAMEQLEHAVKINPDYAEAHRFLGALYIKVFARTQEGIDHLRKSLELDPTQPGAEILKSLIVQNRSTGPNY